jgi:hypothetical protein
MQLQIELVQCKHIVVNRRTPQFAIPLFAMGAFNTRGRGKNIVDNSLGWALPWVRDRSAFVFKEF